MKKFQFVLCLFLCILPCIFTFRGHVTTEEDLGRIATSLGVKREELQDCLNKVESDWDTIMELSDLVLGDRNSQTKAAIRKVGCFGACLYKKNGMMVNSKIMPERVLELVTKTARRPEQVTLIRKAVLDCSKRDPNTTDDCDITLFFSHCVVDEASRQGI